MLPTKMLPTNVFVAGQGLERRLCVSRWSAAWSAIDGAYQELGDSDEPLAWAVSMTEGWGPVTVLHLMDRSMWESIAADWPALHAYLMCGDVTADPLCLQA